MISISKYVEESRNTHNLKDLILQCQELKTLMFSGKLVIKTDIHTPRWTLIFRLGRLNWAGGGNAPHERWESHLKNICPDLGNDHLDLICQPVDRPEIQSNALAQLLMNEVIRRQQVSEVMIEIFGEILFDIIQSSQINNDRLSYKIIAHEPVESQLNLILPLLEIEPLLKKSLIKWQEWCQEGLSKFSPNACPIWAATPDVIEKLPSSYQEISASCDGSKTLRSIAIKNNLSTVKLTKLLLPLVDSKMLVFSSERRLKKLKLIEAKKRDNSDNNTQGNPQSKFLVACIDDSLSVYQSLEWILKQNGYQSFGIQEPLKILPTLIKNKPDFIFLDLLMPITNGYEVCTQIRKTPSLKDIPIVILTGKDGLVDRVRAKMVGSTDFLTKPVLSESVLKMLNKYLPVR